jgi:hypothetical protein
VFRAVGDARFAGPPVDDTHLKVEARLMNMQNWTGAYALRSDAEFLAQLTHERLHGRLTCLDVAAR